MKRPREGTGSERMLYVVEMDFTQPARQAEWDAWYAQHMEVLLSVPGFQTAQRFVCTSAHRAPYLAVYTVTSPEVFESEAYRARGGRESTGEWKPTMTNWDRNLYAGVERAPAVGEQDLLLMTESDRAAASSAVRFAWLRAIGLDRTIERRAIAVSPAAAGPRIVRESGGLIRAYRPL